MAGKSAPAAQVATAHFATMTHCMMPFDPVMTAQRMTMLRLVAVAHRVVTPAAMLVARDLVVSVAGMMARRMDRLVMTGVRRRPEVRKRRRRWRDVGWRR